MTPKCGGVGRMFLDRRDGANQLKQSFYGNGDTTV